MIYRHSLSVAAALAALAAIPSGASADVLISAVDSHLECGAAIRVGVWAQPGTRGSRRTSISVYDAATGRRWWHRSVTAPTKAWRYWTLPSGSRGQCGTTRVVYRVFGAHGYTERETVRFGPGD